jgi:hypothetical protein
MNKIRAFHGRTLSSIQSEVNDFAKNNKIINTSICTEKHGYDIYYTIIVLYEE